MRRNGPVARRSSTTAGHAGDGRRAGPGPHAEHGQARDGPDGVVERHAQGAPGGSAGGAVAAAAAAAGAVLPLRTIAAPRYSHPKKRRAFRR